MVNPFLSIRALTQSREDLLTEFFAGALTIDEGLRRRYAAFVLGPLKKDANARDLSISSIATQVQFPGTACIPDMVLTLSDGRRIIVEHKIDAAETMGYVDKSEDEELRAQLIRYLDLDVDGVVYVRANWKPPDREVREHVKYIKPEHREHFLWQDFYDMLAVSENPYTRWIAEGFLHLGYVPPLPFIGDLTVEENRRNFAKLWQPAASRAHEMGWKVEFGSICELYLTGDGSGPVLELWFRPSQTMLVRLTPSPGCDTLTLIDRLRLAFTASDTQVEVESSTVLRVKGRAEVIELRTSLNLLLQGADTPDEMSSCLLNLVVSVITSLADRQ